MLLDLLKNINKVGYARLAVLWEADKLVFIILFLTLWLLLLNPSDNSFCAQSNSLLLDSVGEALNDQDIKVAPEVFCEGVWLTCISESFIYVVRKITISRIPFAILQLHLGGMPVAEKCNERFNAIG